MLFEEDMHGAVDRAMKKWLHTDTNAKLPRDTRAYSRPIIALKKEAAMSCMVYGRHARVCVCVSVWCSGLYSRFPIETLRARSLPGAVTHIFLLLWVVTNSQMCMSEYECIVGKRKHITKWNCRWSKTATGSCVVQDQAPQQ